MLKINPAKRVVKFLEKVPTKTGKQIAKKLMALRENPNPSDAKKLINTPYTRVDVGEYRIVYFVEEDVLYIVLVGKRNDGEVYK